MYSLLQLLISWRASILPVTDVPVVLPEVVIAPSSAEVYQLLPSGIGRQGRLGEVTGRRPLLAKSSGSGGIAVPQALARGPAPKSSEIIIRSHASRGSQWMARHCSPKRRIKLMENLHFFAGTLQNMVQLLILYSLCLQLCPYTPRMRFADIPACMY
jgi:hypothetical protein